jgi:hypothetical protein
MKQAELNKIVDSILKLEGEELEKAVGSLVVDKINAEEKSATAIESARKAAEASAETISALELKVNDLEGQLADAKDDPEALNRCSKTFKIGKKEYRFKTGVVDVVVPARILNDKKKAGTHSADEIAEDKEIREALVKIEFGGIEEVPTK